MTYARTWWPLISKDDRGEVLDRIDRADSRPLPDGLATRILLAGADLIPIDGAQPDSNSPWVLRDEDVDWIYAHGRDPLAEDVAETDASGSTA